MNAAPPISIGADNAKVMATFPPQSVKTPPKIVSMSRFILQ
jgi:hypothetical protein